MARLFLEILVDVNGKQLKIVLQQHKTTQKKIEQKSSPLWKQKNTQKKNIKTISIGVMSEYKQVDKVIFFYINMFSVINERKEIKL